MTRIAVVGGGITGLVASWHLQRRGVEVLLVEASRRLGGSIRTVPFAGRPVDVGAEAMLCTPAVETLVRALDLEEELVAPAPRPTWVWAAGALRPLPDGVGPSGPTRLGPLVTTRILSPVAKLRAGIEPFIPVRSEEQRDVAVGGFFRRRFGDEVTERLVEPLLGSIYAADIDRLSLHAVAPGLVASTREHGSVLRAVRARAAQIQASSIPTMRAPAGGMQRLTDRLTGSLTDVDTRVATPVEAVEPADGRFRVRLADGGSANADGVVLAAPASSVARILRGLSLQAAVQLSQIRTASVAVALFAYSASAADLPALRGTGMLVPRDTGRALRAATFVSTKWPGEAGSGRVLVRASTGRVVGEGSSAFDDERLIERLSGDLSELAGLPARPAASMLVRWPDAMPQYDVGHHRLVGSVERALGDDIPIVFAGAPYGGVGIASCVDQAERAARSVLGRVEGGLRAAP